MFSLESLNLNRELDGVDLVLVHEWNDRELVRRIGEQRAQSNSFRLLFHDTHHRSVTDAASMSGHDLEHYDGVLAFGEAIRHIYLRNSWTQYAWTWHEAADTRIFKPHPKIETFGDDVWIGNWGDDERAAELNEFLIQPLQQSILKGRVYGVRYPESVLETLRCSNIGYGGWLSNFSVPAIFAQFRATVHVPRRPYATALPGIPTIRPFEALACGIPLVSAPWTDSEHLFRAGKDYLTARNGAEMKTHLRAIVNDPAMAAELSASGRETILARHTCAHRVDELMDIYQRIAPARMETAATGIA